jgi:hypothetical protein
MAWISLFGLFFSFNVLAAKLPEFLTKHSPETLRYISADGRYAYVQKKSGVLGLVSSFRSTDFISDAFSNDFLVKGSRFKTRLIIESIPNAHTEMSLIKNHKLFVVDYGNTKTREIGQGRNPKLHLQDEWVTYYHTTDKVIHIQNLITQKKYEIRLSKKPNPYFIPEVEMVSSRVVVYTDINESGYSAIVSYDLQSQKSTVNYKSTQNGTRFELCQSDDYMAIGEFPYDGASRNSKISTVKTNDSINLSGLTTIYQSNDQDVGNMICLPKHLWFVKTVTSDEKLNLKVTEAAKLELRSQKLEVKTSLNHISQLVEMEGRVLIPYRGQFLVLEGQANIGEDVLKPLPGKEELQIDI